MTVLQITCDNCGAKYKLPDTFTGSQAKCQKCGSVIDVQKQRQTASSGSAPAAAAPAAAKPAAAARPAIDRSKESPKAAERPAAPATRSERPTRRGKDGKDKDDADGGETKGRRGRGEREAKKSNSMPLMLGGVGLLAIVVVVVLMMKGGDKTSEQNAKADTPAATPSATTPPAGEAAKPAAAPAETPKAEPPKAETPKPADASAKPVAPAAPAPAAAPAAPYDPKQPWLSMKNPPASMNDVADPKSYGELKWPEGAADAKKKELTALAADVANGGRAGIDAKKALITEGYLSLYGIAEQLRLMDYKSTDQQMAAFELNKLIEEISAGMNARFAPVEATEELTPAKAEWNTRTVKAWLDILGRLDEATYKKERADRVKKAAADK